MQTFKFTQDATGYLVYGCEEDPTEDMLLARKQVFYALRNTPETERRSGMLGTKTSATVCALGLMARALELFDRIPVESLNGDSFHPTPLACTVLSKATGWPYELMVEAYRRNDLRVVNREDYHALDDAIKIPKGPFFYTWPQVADFLEGALVNG